MNTKVEQWAALVARGNIEHCFASFVWDRVFRDKNTVLELKRLAQPDSELPSIWSKAKNLRLHILTIAALYTSSILAVVARSFGLYFTPMLMNSFIIFNSSINPFLTIFFVPDFNRAAKALMKMKLPKARPNAGVSNYSFGVNVVIPNTTGSHMVMTTNHMWFLVYSPFALMVHYVLIRDSKLGWLKYGVSQFIKKVYRLLYNILIYGPTSCFILYWKWRVMKLHNDWILS